VVLSLPAVWTLIAVGVVILLLWTDQPRAAGGRLGPERDRDLHLVDPAHRHEPRRAAGGDQAERIPARDDVRCRGLVRVLLDTRRDRVRRAAVLMAGSRALRLRVLLALTIWLALIALVKLVEAL
jgi:hypothetical protein